MKPIMKATFANYHTILSCNWLVAGLKKLVTLVQIIGNFSGHGYSSETYNSLLY